METIVLDTIDKRIDKEKEKEQNKPCKGLTPEQMKEQFKHLPFSYFNNQHTPYTKKNIIDVDSIIGYLYSTSYCNPALLGKNKEKFEQELRDKLCGLNPK